MSSSARDTLLTVLGIIGIIILVTGFGFGILCALAGLTVLLLAGIFGVTFPFWSVFLSWCLLGLVLSFIRSAFSE